MIGGKVSTQVRWVLCGQLTDETRRTARIANANGDDNKSANEHDADLDTVGDGDGPQAPGDAVQTNHSAGNQNTEPDWPADKGLQGYRQSPHGNAHGKH